MNKEQVKEQIKELETQLENESSDKKVLNEKISKLKALLKTFEKVIFK